MLELSSNPYDLEKETEVSNYPLHAFLLPLTPPRPGLINTTFISYEQEVLGAFYAL